MSELVSVIVPAYNQESYIDDCLNSIIAQTYQNWECIIVDDGSTDKTLEKIKIWTAKDSRFRYITKQNSGVCDTRNVGIQNAKAAWILPVDADDIISNDYLELATQYFDDEDIKIIYGGAEYFEAKTGKWNLPTFSLEKLAYENIIYNSAFFRKSDWERVGGYDTNLIHGMEDWDFWISILKDGGKVKKIENICFFYRIKKGSRSAILIRETYTSSLKIIDKKHIAFFQTHLPSYHRILYDYRDLQKVLKSKRYALVDDALKIIGR